MDTEDEPVDIVSGGEAKEMDKEAESILKDWSQEKEIPSLQGRLAESWRLVDRWNLERANPDSVLKENVIVWSMSAFMDEVFGANWVSRIPAQNFEFGTFSIADAMIKLEEESSKDGHTVRLLKKLTFDVEDVISEDDGESSLSDLDDVLKKEFPLLYSDNVAERGYLGVSISVEAEESMPVTHSAGTGPQEERQIEQKPGEMLEDGKGRPLLESMRSNYQDGSFRFQEPHESEGGVAAIGGRSFLLPDALRTEESVIEECPRGMSQNGLLASMRNMAGKLNTQLESPVLNDRDNDQGGDAMCTPNIVPESQTEIPAQHAANQAMDMLHSDPAHGVPAENVADQKQEKKAARQKRLANQRKQHYSAVMAPRDVSRPDIGSSLQNLKTRRRVSSKVKSPAGVEKGTEEPILSGLGISTEVFAPTCTDKEDTALNEDETLPERRSKRRQSKQGTKKTTTGTRSKRDASAPKNSDGMVKNNGVSQSPGVSEKRKKGKNNVVVAEKRKRGTNNVVVAEKRKRGTHDDVVPEKVSATPKRTRRRRSTSATPVVSAKVSKKDKDQTPAPKVKKIDLTNPPEKVGCPKCRWRGCKKCRGYTLAELREWEQQNSLEKVKNDGPTPNHSERSAGTMVKQSKKQKNEKQLQLLQGFTFFVTILDKSLKHMVIEEITSMGGKIEDNLSNILKGSGTNVRTRKSSTDQSNTLVVTNNAKNKTIKAILARVAGIPFVTPDWVHACKEKNSVGSLSTRSPNVLLGRNTKGVGPMLQNLRILLVIDKKNKATKMFETLVKHLGATCVASLDPELGHGTCDLVLYDSSSDASDLKAEIHRLERIARRLRIPSYPLSWLTDGIVSEGKFSPSIPSLKHREKKKDTPIVIPATEEEESEEESLQVSIGAKEDQPQDQHPIERNHTPATAMQGNSEREEYNKEPAPFQVGTTAVSSLLRETVHTDPSSMNLLPRWRLVDPCDPPDGFKRSPVRQYFKTAISDDEKISVDDFVKLLPDPGRHGPKIAQVVALWKQTGMPDGNKIFGKFRRYYRFDETSITLMQITREDGGNRIFETNHFEDNLPVASVMSKCNVEILQSPMVSRDMLTEDGQASTDPILYCTAFYDYETGAILPLH